MAASQPIDRIFLGHLHGCRQRMQELQKLGRQLAARGKTAERDTRMYKGAFETLKAMIQGLQSNKASRGQLEASVARAQHIGREIQKGSKVQDECRKKGAEIERELLTLKGRHDTLVQMIQVAQKK